MSTQRRSAPTLPTDTVSRESGRYLLELYFASIETDERIRTGTLGERLDVNPASVTEMVSKLDAIGYVDYEKHEGTRLTASGTEVAEVLAWRYCVTERFFLDELDAPVNRPTVYRIGFELPVDGLVTLAETVNIPCMRACSRTKQTAPHSHCSIPDA